MLKNIINKSINNGLALPELVHQWTNYEFDAIEDYEVFENDQLSYMESTQPDAKEIAQIYVNIYGEIDIPEEIMECVQQATEEGLSVEGFCMDCLYENCFDYDFDDEVNIWLNEMGRDYSDKVNTISNLWARYTLFEEYIRS